MAAIAWCDMATILSRLRALEPHALLNGFQLDYAASQQNGSDCWFIATISMLRKKGYRLDGFDVKCLRSRTYDWLDGRREQYRWYGEEYWKFVGNWERAWVTNLAVMAALTVLSEGLFIADEPRDGRAEHDRLGLPGADTLSFRLSEDRPAGLRIRSREALRGPSCFEQQQGGTV